MEISNPARGYFIAIYCTVNAGVKYQTISASTSSVNLGNITYGGQTSYVQAESIQQLKSEHRTEKREEIHHDLMATMMQQHQGKNKFINKKYKLLI